MAQVQGNDPVEDRGQQVLGEHHRPLLEGLRNVLDTEAGLEKVLHHERSDRRRSSIT
ncbi:hypothetical protein JHN63_22505 [Streptomyces sp. MBT65]|uniref:hypothetical protein n=1 Tax=Streptomyces sp. MBT65 TaxID=1488395 RepID=UPI00190BC818|nr:hypothetical protein [Streptomyces sp. MBT65]MBK3576526.1 hypothetical protein [Streptomyces sp. MBT65]